MSRERISTDSLNEATRERAHFSGHGDAKGAEGVHGTGDVVGPRGFLTQPGETDIVNPQEHGFHDIRIGMEWQNRNRAGAERNILQKMVAGVTGHGGVDLDLGCLYELQSGARGAIQAFGDRFGKFDEPPFITLSGDDRSGDRKGEDEFLVINGRHWPDIKRVLLYAYIYQGAPDWYNVHPHIEVRVPGEPAMGVTPSLHDGTLPVCAVATLENIRDGIKMTAAIEYFAGHAEMDRAFGYGLHWEEGVKT